MNGEDNYEDFKDEPKCTKDDQEDLMSFNEKFELIKKSVESKDEGMIEYSLMELFLKKFDLTNTLLPDIFMYLTQHIEVVVEVIEFNAKLLIIFHTLCSSDIKELVRPFVDALYTTASPREILLVHTSIPIYTEDKNTLLNALSYLPNIISCIPSPKIELLFDKMKEYVMNTYHSLGDISSESDKNVIYNTIDAALSTVPSCEKATSLLLTIISNFEISETLESKLQDKVLANGHVANAFLSLSAENVLVYLSVNLQLPLVLSKSVVYKTVLNAIKNAQLPSHSVLKILETLIENNQDELDAEIVLKLYTSLSYIQTDDLKFQREIVSTFESFIFDRPAPVIYEILKQNISNEKFRALFSYSIRLMITLVKSISSTLEAHKVLKCCEGSSVVLSGIHDIIEIALQRPDFYSLDKYMIVQCSEDIMSTCSFVQLMVCCNYGTTLQPKKYLETLEKIYVNLLKVRTILQQGMTHDDKKELEKAQLICNITANGEKVDFNKTDAFERNVSRVELCIFRVENTISALKSRVTSAIN
ncbi:hypothetical protein EIN_284090 [Entamoeba invadens IP1]|uniref:Uncharacterized protein n=1 Tax=Entamoeba invadens IP1 TaxID=370355 RepID=L7FLX3_ENTIV|nr:hypothetical protein EIN_284090 [Entamoeba invadens IP1]ELP84853.1 hypothetical protein EIN_284090 [Entamoeba invadens IP1]|eukprot:XP_004184199.1 hypothetical protein EIN_284090 [Entamoeba invadens IP1]